jgi:hypothetical protein
MRKYMMAKIAMNGANCISMSVELAEAAPAAWAKADVVNKGQNSEARREAAPQRGVEKAWHI